MSLYKDGKSPLPVQCIICRKTTIAAITSLDLDHTSLLGNSLESITWNKCGIMKDGSTLFCLKQPENIMKIIKDRSVEKKVFYKFYIKSVQKLFHLEKILLIILFAFLIIQPLTVKLLGPINILSEVWFYRFIICFHFAFKFQTLSIIFY